MICALRQRFAAAPADLPDGDYVSPGLEVVRLDDAFPDMVRGDAANHPWRYLRREIPHAWYVDKHYPLMGFLNRDEAVLLYNIARQFEGRRALEIGCWLGWSTCHLALGGVNLDVVDPALADPQHRAKVEKSVAFCGLDTRIHLHAAASPEGVHALAARQPWSLFFIDGDHEAPGPERDVEACLDYAAADAAFVFQDLTSPHVAIALRLLEARGFTIQLYQTMQIMAVAWRGKFVPPVHIPDPTVQWQLPHHLVGLPVSGASFPGFPAVLRQRLADQATEIGRLMTKIDELHAIVSVEKGRVQRLKAQVQMRMGTRLKNFLFSKR
jgi:predicted O-methyltransferase YrrM